MYLRLTRQKCPGVSKTEEVRVRMTKFRQSDNGSIVAVGVGVVNVVYECEK